MKKPWTRAELDRLIPLVDGRLAAAEFSRPDVRPLPPMSVAECMERFGGMVDLASRRPLTIDECHLFGQLLAVYAMAVRAEFAGYQGRVMILTEHDLAEELRP